MIGKGRLQSRLKDIERDRLAPDPFAVLEVSCVIQRVYDSDTLNETGISSELASLIIANPGWLFAKVGLYNNTTTLILPFRDSEELIYTIYGNRVLLEGRPATIVYSNQDIQNGFIVLQRSLTKPHVKLSQSSKTFDISGII
jgi:hypothetical protein